MSLEAWGDEGDTGMDGYVTDEIHQEAVDEGKEALRLLLQVRHHIRVAAGILGRGDRADTQMNLQHTYGIITAWLKYHTPLQPNESLEVAIAREGKDLTFGENYHAPKTQNQET